MGPHLGLQQAFLRELSGSRLYDLTALAARISGQASSSISADDSKPSPRLGWGRASGLDEHRSTTSSGNFAIQIGRELGCSIRLEDHRQVSRQHAVLCWEIGPLDNGCIWTLCDLGSANGTFVNGLRLEGCQVLRGGDRIQLGRSGPQFCFELQSKAPPPDSKAGCAPSDTVLETSPVAASLPAPSPPAPPSLEARAALTVTRLFPILSTGPELTHKAFLIPGSFTVLVVVSLFLTVGQPERFNPLLASYLAAAGYYFIYRLCGKHKPWWLLVAAAGFTLALLSSPALQGFLWFFRVLLPGQIPPSGAAVSLPVRFGQVFLGAGLMEELIKVLPVLLAWGIGRLVPAAWQRRLGVWEPLDGILLGAASAVGFTLLETLGHYVPNAAAVVGASATEAQLAGLQLLIPRLLGSIAGHMAYSGYLGYFVGLSVLMPRHRWQILGVGYVTAAFLHALWNVAGNYSALLLTLVGVLSYACLVAAILKARALSPTRSQNFATRLAEPPVRWCSSDRTLGKPTQKRDKNRGLGHLPTAGCRTSRCWGRSRLT